MDIHHITHRTAEECRATAELAKHTSWSQAINTFRAKLDIQVMSRKNNPETPAITSRLMRKHKTVLNYLESRYADFYRRYDYAQPLPDDGLPGGAKYGCAGGRASTTPRRWCNGAWSPFSATSKNMTSSF